MEGKIADFEAGGATAQELPALRGIADTNCAYAVVRHLKSTEIGHALLTANVGAAVIVENVTSGACPAISAREGDDFALDHGT
jgi:hypothetical protein